MNILVEKVYLYEVNFRNYKILAYADIIIDNVIKLKSIKLLQNTLDNSTFLQMPTCKDTKKPFFEILNKSISDSIKNLILEKIRLEYDEIS